MAHYKTDATRAEATPSEWLPVGRQIGELANAWAMRSDIVAYVGPGAGGPAPACFIPASAEVEVNVDVAFGYGVEPEDIRLDTRSGRYEFPKATGAIAHEAFHARYSLWNMKAAYDALEKDEYEALTLLEESRIEARGAKDLPKMRPFLRSCAMEIVIADAAEQFSTMSNTQAAAQLVGLVWARVDAGILNLADVAEVTDLIDTYLGLDVVSRLREIALDVQAHTNDYNVEALYPLAKEWAALVRDVAEEKGDTAPEPDKGEPGDSGEGEGSGASEFVKALMDAMDEAAENTAVAVAGDLEDAETSEKYEEVVSERAEKAREIKASGDAAAKVFGKGTAVIDFGKSHSSLIDKRAPKSEERVAMVQVATMLEKAKYRERDLTFVRSEIPAGRMRTRAMVQREALRSKGVMTKVEPFEHKVRKQTDEPTLTVGVLVDISGSMGSAMQPMATTAYVMAAAAHRVQGKAAMVYYGNDVFPTLRVGERMDEVRVYSAPDGTEKFDEAFRALDGAVNLLHGSGARLLVIVSDGEYTTQETAAAKRWMRRCAEEGVAVVWLPFDHGHGAKGIAGEHGTVLGGAFSPVAAATQIGKACADALTRVGARV